MRSVLGLVKYYALLTVYNTVCHLMTSFSREAVHENGVFFCNLHYIKVDLVGMEYMHSVFFLVFWHVIAHPRIGVNYVGAFCSFFRVACYCHRALGGELQRFFHEITKRLKFLSLRTNDRYVNALHR